MRWGEMEKIPEGQREQPPTLMVQSEIHRVMKQFEGMAAVVEKLTKLFPDHPEY